MAEKKELAVTEEKVVEIETERLKSLHYQGVCSVCD